MEKQNISYTSEKLPVVSEAVIETLARDYAKREIENNTDNFMDEILKRMNLGGENMGERLQRLDISKLESLNLVWEAHKIRNRIVHDSSYNLRSDEAKKAVENYGKALKELQVL